MGISTKAIQSLEFFCLVLILWGDYRGESRGLLATWLDYSNSVSYTQPQGVTENHPLQRLFPTRLTPKYRGCILMVIKLLYLFIMVRTYTYGVNLHFKKSPKHAHGYDITEEVSWLPFDGDENLHNISEEQVALRKSVIDYDQFGCGWRNPETGRAWLFGCMTEEMMDEMDKKLDTFKKGEVL